MDLYCKENKANIQNQAEPPTPYDGNAMEHERRARSDLTCGRGDHQMTSNRVR